MTEAQLSEFNLDVPVPEVAEADAADIILRNCAVDLQSAKLCDLDRAEQHVHGSNKALSMISTFLAPTIAQEVKVQMDAILPGQLRDIQGNYSSVIARILTRAVKGCSKAQLANEFNGILDSARMTRPTHASVIKSIIEVKRAPLTHTHTHTFGVYSIILHQQL